MLRRADAEQWHSHDGSRIRGGLSPCGQGAGRLLGELTADPLSGAARDPRSRHYTVTAAN